MILLHHKLNTKNKMNLQEKILKLKEEQNAVLLAHYYTYPEIQDIADCLGDSLALAQYAQKTNADKIIFAGVYFMAETAKILNPDKKVLIPDVKAACSLADSCKTEDFVEFKKMYPEHKVVSYVNCSAEMKALSDVVVTSSNAVKIVESFKKDEKIIFAPDRNLGDYINKLTGRNMILWDGCCHVHNSLMAKDMVELRKKYPDAELIAHPECTNMVLQFADFIGSTTQLLAYAQKSASKSFIVATETGILHKMQAMNPDKTFIIASDNYKSCSCNDCQYMKLNTLEKIYNCLLSDENEIVLSKEIIEKAKISILKMLELS